MIALTVFTPTYNRAHTLGRTYASLARQTCKDFEWLIIDDGSTDNTYTYAKEWIAEQKVSIRYMYKENGGLFTGYNSAYEHAQGELVVCVDSDDYMPDNAVELIVNTWQQRGSKHYAGLLGLDFLLDGTPIGGYFPTNLSEVYYYELNARRIRTGDSKPVLRTDLARQVTPMIGFTGEKNFNPVYMTWQVCDLLPLLILNENICFVDYQYQVGGDSMSAGIWKQYANSPHSFQKQRILEMQLRHNCLSNRLRVAIHYVAESLLANDPHWLRHSPCKFLTFIVSPTGFCLYLLILWKNR